LSIHLPVLPSFFFTVVILERYSSKKPVQIIELVSWGYGEGGIRTLVKVTPKQHFQCCAFNRSATSPSEAYQGYLMSLPSVNELGKIQSIASWL
jgi:hypothetical protein